MIRWTHRLVVALLLFAVWCFGVSLGSREARADSGIPAYKQAPDYQIRLVRYKLARAYRGLKVIDAIIADKESDLKVISEISPDADAFENTYAHDIDATKASIAKLRAKRRELVAAIRYFSQAYNYNPAQQNRAYAAQ